MTMTKTKLTDGERALLIKLIENNGQIKWVRLSSIESGHGTRLSRRFLTKWELKPYCGKYLLITQAGIEATQ